MDIEGDGDLDIYVCNYDSPNHLFINRSESSEELKFVESARDYGLDLVDASFMSTFADYDQDGDLDALDWDYGTYSMAEIHETLRDIHQQQPVDRNKLPQDAAAAFPPITNVDQFENGTSEIAEISHLSSFNHKKTMTERIELHNAHDSHHLAGVHAHVVWAPVIVAETLADELIHFWGAYGYLSYFITGQYRQYNRALGVFAGRE